MHCTSLTSVRLSNSITSIEHSTFYGCSSLTSITIPDSVTSIGDGAFEDCSALTSITIPDGVTSIGSLAFALCSSLTSIIIPDSVTSIDWGALWTGSSLTIYGYEGSYAQKYASENGIPFQIYTGSIPETPGTPDAGSQNTVYLPEGESGISSASMQALVDSNKTQAITIVNAAGIRFTFAAGSMQMIDGKEVYDFGAEIVKSYNELKNAPFSADKFVARINYNYSGKLPGTASISIPVGTEWAGRMLYYYEIKADGTYSYVTNGKVDANGNVTVTQNHCSDYVLTTQAPALSPKTGDTASAALYIVMGLLAAFGIAAFSVTLGKRKNSF